MPLDPAFVLTLFGAGLVVAVLPRPTNPIAWTGSACLILLAVGTCGMAVTAVLILFAAWTLVPTAVGLTAVIGLTGAYLGGVPEVAEDDAAEPRDDDDEGGGGGGQPRKPPADVPPGGGDTVDWQDFDAQRAGWDERVPVGV